MNYGWNIESDFTFGGLCRDLYYANLLADNIMAENITEVQSLLEYKKANPNTVVPESGVAPLHLLAGLENEDFSSRIIIQAILKNSGDPNVRSEEGLTPVHVAAMWGRCKVLEILLVNGGDPELIDYKLFLNAEEYAIKEQQWKAYGIIGAFSIMEEVEEKMGSYPEYTSYCGSESNNESLNFSNKEVRPLKNKHLLKLKDKATNRSDDTSSSKGSDKRCAYSVVQKNKTIHNMNQADEESCSDRSDWSRPEKESLKLNLGALSSIRRQRRITKTYKSIEPTSDQDCIRSKRTGNPHKENSNESSSYGDNVSESCDWLRKSVESTNLDEKALNTIRNQRLFSRIYQTVGLGTDPLKSREKKPPLYEESETVDWVEPKKFETFDNSSLNKINTHRKRTTTYKSDNLEEPSMLDPGPKLPKRNKNKLHNKKEDEMYLCGYAEESIRHDGSQRRSQYLSSGLSDVNSSDFDEEGIPNQRMLCKMSRIFLFMLKKRHIYAKIK